MSGIRERSGNVDGNDPLVGFIYLMLRDYVVPGDMEKVLNTARDLVCSTKSFQFSNGWLAQYAQDIVNRLRGIPDTGPCIGHIQGPIIDEHVSTGQPVYGEGRRCNATSPRRADGNFWCDECYARKR